MQKEKLWPRRDFLQMGLLTVLPPLVSPGILPRAAWRDLGKGQEPRQQGFLSQEKVQIAGIGGAGGRILRHLRESGFKKARDIAIDSDSCDLDGVKRGEKVYLQPQRKQGCCHLPAPLLRQAVEERRDRLVALLHGTKSLCIVTGLGGDTGTAVSPLIAQIAKAQEIFTLALVILPFPFEGPRRLQKAEEGLLALREQADCLIVIPAHGILPLLKKPANLRETFHTLDGIAAQALEALYDAFSPPEDALLYEDYFLEMALTGSTDARIGMGRGTGKDSPLKAVQAALSSPLLEHRPLKEARGALLHMSWGKKTTLEEINTAAAVFENALSQESQLVWVMSDQPDRRNESRATLILF